MAAAKRKRKPKVDKTFRVCLKPLRDDFGKVLRDAMTLDIKAHHPIATDSTEEGYIIFMLVNVEGRTVLMKNFAEIDYCVELSSIVAEETKPVEIKKAKLVSLAKVEPIKSEG
jgi:hypothetical protein